ncbi:hypothetical protein JXA63_05025 [Candidatus Woesebacteria bacterium]|nr:hypothetical protein [Candidatus Woesebacteria bacterium]
MSERLLRNALTGIVGSIGLIGKSPEEQAEMVVRHPAGKPQPPTVYVAEQRLIRGGKFLNKAGDAGIEAINNVIDADQF